MSTGFKLGNPGCACCDSTGTHVPGCSCDPSPISISMSVSEPLSNGQIFQPASIVYGPTDPMFAPLGMPPNSYISSTSFTDGITGDTFWYNIGCYFGYYTLTRLYLVSAYGSPYRDTILYRWPVSSLGNTCSPFRLVNGTMFSGGDTSCIVSLTG